jgi:hypothetical protein
MKKIILLLFFVSFIFGLAACSTEVDLELESPTNVTISGDVVSWNVVDQADSYIVFINTTEVAVQTTSYDLSNQDLAAGSYSITVVAVKDDKLSLPSTVLTYTVAEASNPDLAAPTNVAISDGVVTWNSVVGATGYVVHVGTLSFNVTATTIDLKDQTIAEGSYSVYVTASNTSGTSTSSTSVSYVVAAAAVDVIDAPTNVSITDGVLTWNSVSGATGYVVYVGTLSLNVTGTTIDLNDESIAVGSYSVYVRATDGTDFSADSLSVSYNVELNVDQDTIKLSIMRRMKTSYTLDLDEDDFENTYDYNSYLEALDMAEAVSTRTIMMGMTATEAIDLFDQVESMMDNVDDMVEGESVMTLSDIMSQLDSILDFDMDSEDLANLVYDLVMTMLDSSNRFLELDILYEEEQLPTYTTQMSAITSTTNYTQAYNYMKSFADPSEYDALDELFSGEYRDLISAMYELRNISLYGDSGFPIDPSYYAYEYPQLEAYILDLKTITEAIELDSEGSAFMLDLSTTLDNLYILHGVKQTFDDINMSIDEYEDEILMNGEIKAELISSKADIIDSLVVVIDFVLTFEESINTETLALLDDLMAEGELTVTEMFTLKDELVLILENALPEVTDFETIYTTLFIIGGNVADYDMTDYMDYAETLGQAQYYSTDLLLSLATYIDEDLIVAANLILDDFDFETADMLDVDNVDVAIEFALFVIEELETFKGENLLQINAMKTLVPDTLIEDIYVEFLDLAIDRVENNYDEFFDQDEKDMIVGVLEDLQDEFDTYKAVVDIFGESAGDILSYMIDTEGSLITKIIEFDPENPNMLTMLTEAASIIGEINAIDDLLFGDIVEVETRLDALFEAAKLPLKTALEAEGSDIDFDVLYPILAPEIKTVILNVISLQSDLMAQADSLTPFNMVSIFTSGTIEMGVYNAAITVVNNTLTTANQTMIYDTIDIIFDDILSNSAILSLIEENQTDIDDMKAQVEDEVEYIIDEFTALGLFDFSDLSQIQEDRLDDFLTYFEDFFLYLED